MPSKKTNTRKSATRSGKRTTTGSSTRGRSDADHTVTFNSVDSKKMISTWTEAQKELTDQMSKLMGMQQGYTEDLSRKWADVSEDISRAMGDATPSDKTLGQLYGSWDKYRANMNERMERLLETESKTFERLNESWKSESTRMEEALRSIAEGKDVGRASEMFYVSWMSLSKEMNERFKDTLESGGEEMRELRDTWMDFLKNLESMTKEIQAKTPSIAKAVEPWREATWRMNSEILRYCDASMAQMNKIHSSWLESVSEANSQVLKGTIRAIEKERPKNR